LEGLSNPHRGKVRKAQPVRNPFIIVEEESPRIPCRGWAEMIKKVYELDPLICPKCQGKMRTIAFLTDYAVVDRIIAHLKLSFVAERPPPPSDSFSGAFNGYRDRRQIFFMIFSLTRQKSG